MKLEDQVCNVYLSGKLKQLGIYQLTMHRYHNYGGGYKLFNNGSDQSISHCCVATYTVAELGMMLREIKGTNIFIDWDKDYIVYANKVFVGISKTEADARASLVIYLLENNLTTPEEVNKRLQ